MLGRQARSNPPQRVRLPLDDHGTAMPPGTTNHACLLRTASWRLRQPLDARDLHLTIFAARQHRLDFLPVVEAAHTSILQTRSADPKRSRPAAEVDLADLLGRVEPLHTATKHTGGSCREWLGAAVIRQDMFASLD
jgi:hypothetical protein